MVTAAAYDAVVVGAGMLGSAAAAALQRGSSGMRLLLVGPVGSALSSHNDYSRLVTGVEHEESGRSVATYRAVEQESGVPFFHETGSLVIGGAYHSTSTTPDAGHEVLIGVAAIRQRWSYLDASEVAGLDVESCVSTFQTRSAGWIDPRAHVRAHATLASVGGAEVVDEHVVGLQRCVADGALWELELESGTLARAPRVILALGAWTNARLPTGGTLLPAGVRLNIAAWGKTVFHARVSPASAEALADMPVVILKYSDAAVPESAVQYEGSKKGFYVYFFPPIRYDE